VLDNTDTVSWADVRLIGRTPIDDIVHLAEILAEGEENSTPEKEETDVV
jgi:hypothetical protein